MYGFYDAAGEVILRRLPTLAGGVRIKQKVKEREHRNNLVFMKDSYGIIEDATGSDVLVT